MPTRNLTRLLLALTLALAAPGVASACAIPVFRYALERWDLAPYELVVFHRGGLADEVDASLRKWAERANLVVKPVDLAGKLTPAQQKLWDAQGNAEPLPWCVLGPPEAQADTPPVWAGTFDAATVRGLVDSPLRRRIVATLTGGDSAAFVLLLSGDRAADDAAAAMLENEVARLRGQLKLPPPKADGPKVRLALPVRIGFTTLPLSRDDPAEAGFLKVVFSTDPALADVKGPILLPVIGRGRLLGSLSGADLNPEGVEEVARFVCGACSCEVKELNPGADLLVRADWHGIFEAIGPASADTQAAESTLPSLPVPPATRPAREITPTPAPPAAETPAPDRRTWLYVGIAVAAGLVVVTGGWAGSRLFRRA